MSTAARLSLADFDQMIKTGVFDGRRLEFIRGEIREMTPKGSEHEAIVDRLNEWSIRTLPEEQVRIRVQNSIGLPPLESAPEPDIAWVARRNYADARPTAADVLLVIEVADSSLAYDRGEKADLYAAAGVKDYWIINLIERCIEVFRSPGADHYHSLQTHTPGNPLSPLAFPQITLDPAELWDD